MKKGRKISVTDSVGKSHEIVDNYGVMNTTYAMQDVDTGIFFARQLEYRIAKAYEVLYPQFPARNLFPINREGGAWAESYVTEVFNKVGKAKWGVGEEIDDIPRADVSGSEVRTIARPIVTGFKYTWLEVQKAMHAGRALEAMRANAARFSFEEMLNRVAFFGDSKVLVPGLFSNTDIPKEAASATGTANATTFASKVGDPDKIIADIQDIMTDPFTDSNMIHRPNVLLLPVAQWNLITQTRIDDYNTMTIYKWLMENSPAFMNGAGIIKPVNELKGAVSNADVMVAYPYSSDILELHIPMEQQFFPVQEEGFNFYVNSLGITGGLVVRYPKAIRIRTGI